MVFWREILVSLMDEGWRLVFGGMKVEKVRLVMLVFVWMFFKV